MRAAVGRKDCGDVALFIFLGQCVRRRQRTLYALSQCFGVAEHLPDPFAARKIVTAGTGDETGGTSGGFQELPSSDPMTCHSGLP